MTGFQTVWLVERGDYEQRGPVAVFTSLELAAAYCAEYDPDEAPTAMVMWDRLPMPVTRFERQGVYGDDSLLRQWREWTQREGGWVQFRQWATNEAYCSEPVTPEELRWWGRAGAVYITVSGSDQVLVDAEFERLWAEVVQGARPKETQ